MRDGGIDAVAALEAALAEALVHASQDSHPEMKLAVGRAMAAILDETVNPAIRAYSQLEPSQETWMAIARARAVTRGASQDRTREAGSLLPS